MRGHLWSAMTGRALGLFALGGVLALVGITILLFNLGWIRKMRAGPQTVNAAFLEQVRDPVAAGKPWVSFQAGQMFDAGKAHVTTNRRGDVLGYSRYVLLEVEGSYVPARVAGNHNGPIIGYLDTVPRDATVEEQFAKSRTQYQIPAEKVLPYYIDGTYDYKGQCNSMLMSVAVFMILGVVLIVLGLGDWVKGLRAAERFEDKFRERRKRDRRD